MAVETVDRAGGQPARAGAGGRAPARAADPGPAQRGAREDPAARRDRRVPGLPRPSRSRSCSGSAENGAGMRRAIEAVRNRASRGDRRGLQPHRALRPRPRGGGCPDPGAARGRGGPPPPAAHRDAHARGPGAGVRRAPRGASLRAADRVRRQRREPLPRLRDHPRPGPAGDDPGPRGTGRAALREGRQQGHRQGHLEDGDLVDPELPRRPGLRGDRAQPGLHRRVLHVDADAHRRGRHRGDREGGAPAPRPGVPAEAADRAPPAGRGRPVPVPRRRRVAPLQPAHHPQAAARLPERRLRGVQGVLAARRRPVPRACARCAA